MTPRIPHPVSRMLLAGAVVLALAGAGCARSVPPGGSGATSPASSGGSTGSPSPGGTGGPSRSPTAPGPTAPAPSAGVLTLDGVARHGVEPGCTVFAADNHTLYLLLGTGGHTPDQQSIPLGVPLRVRGVPVDQFVSYCQQGRPLEIVDVTRR